MELFGLIMSMKFGGLWTTNAFRMTDHYQPIFTKLTSVAGILGCLILIMGCVIAPFFVTDYNWVTDTISDLAAGDSEFIMDFALYGFAMGLFATALVAANLHLGGIMWSVSIVSLTIAAALVVIIGARNEYGDGDNEGIVVHMYLVYGLGFLFFIIPLLMAKGIKNLSGPAHLFLIGLACLWIIFAPIFLFMPTSYDGALERVLGLIACAIITTVNFTLIKCARKSE